MDDVLKEPLIEKEGEVPSDEKYVSLDESKQRKSSELTYYESSNFRAEKIDWAYLGDYFRLQKIGDKITHKDLYDISEDLRTSVLYDDFEKNWKLEVMKENPSLWKCLGKSYWKDIVIIVVFLILSNVFQFGIPVVIPYMLTFIDDPTVPYYWGYVYASIVLITSFLSSLFWFKSLWASNLLGLRTKTALQAAVYHKAVNSTFVKAGQFINLFSQDAPYLFFLTPLVIPCFVTPVTMIIGVILLGFHIHVFALIAMGILFIVVPISFYSGRFIGEARLKMQSKVDKRLVLANELIRGIRIVKYYVWEKAIMGNINIAREKELDRILIISLIRTFVQVLPNLAPTLIMATTFLLFGFYGGTLSPQLAYTCFAITNLIRLPLGYLSVAGVYFFVIYVAVLRIREGLLTHSIEPYLQKRNDIGITIKDATFKWLSAEYNTLNDISLNVCVERLYLY